MIRKERDGVFDRQSSKTTLVTQNELTDKEKKELHDILGPDSPIEAAAFSDMTLDGNFGTEILVLCSNKLCVINDQNKVRKIPYLDIQSSMTRDYVGNGMFEIKTKDSRRHELVRYSRTHADAFAQMAKRINQKLGVTQEEQEAEAEEMKKSGGPTEEAPTYRCPNCGHPLQNPWDSCPKCANVRHVMRRLFKYLKPYWPLVVLSQITSLIFTMTTLAPGYLLRFLIDTALTEELGLTMTQAQRLEQLVFIVGIFLGAIIVRVLSMWGRIRLMGYLGQRIVFELRKRLYRAFQRLSLSYYDKEHTGRLMSRMLSDTQAIQRFMNMGLQQIVVHSTMVIGIAVILFSENARLAAIALIPVPIVIMIGKIFSSKFKSIFRTVRRRTANLSAAVNENISGVRVVKSFAQEEREIEGFDVKNEDVLDAHMSAVRTRGRFNPLIIFLMMLATLALWYFGGRAVIVGTISLGVLTQYITYMNQFYPPMQQLLNLTEMFQQSATAAERLFNIIDTPSEVADHVNAVKLKDPKGLIKFNDVSFEYEVGERILKEINIDIQPGKMIGLVGQTGSGKSTLVSLLCRFYDPTKGSITIDGIDLRDIDTKSLRNNIGMVLQDSFLFAGTIKENIAYGKPQADEEEIIEAAKAANAHDFIVNLPDGYDSEVGERGVMLSGGEKQRISIARAILKNPRILILDEATSAVDTATELSIQGALDRLIAGRTTIAIAHRLSTLRNADRLYVLDKGQVIEEGSHRELLDQDGEYAKLCKIQANFAKEVG